MDQQHFSAQGKLLLTAEYAVLRGAEALAIPTKRGQTLTVEPSSDNIIHWSSSETDGQLWFTAKFDEDLKILETTHQSRAQFLQNLLMQGLRLSDFSFRGLKITSHLDFPHQWGLGSSSTTTHLIAQFLKIDPFELFRATQNGSAYDIACAKANGPILFKLNADQTRWREVKLSTIFKDVRVVYTNNKQSSSAEISRFSTLSITESDLIRIGDITTDMLRCETLLELQQIMDEHEEIMSSILRYPTVKERLFPDLEGSVKSLGAWGGDFAMIASQTPDSYFTERGYFDIFKLEEI